MADFRLGASPNVPTAPKNRHLWLDLRVSQLHQTARAHSSSSQKNHPKRIPAPWSKWKAESAAKPFWPAHRLADFFTASKRDGYDRPTLFSRHRVALLKDVVEADLHDGQVIRVGVVVKVDMR